MKHGKIYVAGIGPGSEEDITPAVRTAIMQSDVVVGYKYYFNFIRSIVRPETECIDTGMKKEKDRQPSPSSMPNKDAPSVLSAPEMPEYTGWHPSFLK